MLHASQPAAVSSDLQSRATSWWHIRSSGLQNSYSNCSVDSIGSVLEYKGQVSNQAVLHEVLTGHHLAYSFFLQLAASENATRVCSSARLSNFCQSAQMRMVLESAMSVDIHSSSSSGMCVPIQVMQNTFRKINACIAAENRFAILPITCPQPAALHAARHLRLMTNLLHCAFSI